MRIGLTVSLAVSVLASQAMASAGVPIARYGIWEVWSAPPNPPPPGQAMASMAAMIRANSTDGITIWQINIDLDGRLEAVISTNFRNGACEKSVTLPGHEMPSVQVVTKELDRQMNSARQCMKNIGVKFLPEGREIARSKVDIENALLAVKRVIESENQQRR